MSGGFPTPFLRVPAEWRERLSQPPYVEQLRALVIADDLFEIAEWMAAQEVPVTVTTIVDMATVEWLYAVGGAEHAANLDRRHREAGLPPVARPGPAQGVARAKARAQRKRQRQARRRGRS